MDICDDFRLFYGRQNRAIFILNEHGPVDEKITVLQFFLRGLPAMYEHNAKTRFVFTHSVQTSLKRLSGPHYRPKTEMKYPVDVNRIGQGPVEPFAAHAVYTLAMPSFW